MVTLSQVLFGFSMLCSLLVVVGLWWLAAARPRVAEHGTDPDGRVARAVESERSFWRLLALAWTVTLVGTVIWIAYDMVIGMPLPPLSLVDGFYLARYGLIGLALWRFPIAWPRRRIWELGGLLAVVAAAAWFGHYRDVLATAAVPVSFVDVLGVAVYPVLDVALVAGGYLRMRQMEQEASRNLYHLLTLSFGLYGVANWLNFDIRLGMDGSLADPASLLWLLSDLVMVSSVIRLVARRRSIKAAGRARQEQISRSALDQPRGDKGHEDPHA